MTLLFVVAALCLSPGFLVAAEAPQAPAAVEEAPAELQEEPGAVLETELFTPQPQAMSGGCCTVQEEIQGLRTCLFAIGPLGDFCPTCNPDGSCGGYCVELDEQNPQTPCDP